MINVSLIVRDKVARQCPQTTTSEEIGERKRIQTEDLQLTSRMPYRSAKPAYTELRGWPFVDYGLGLWTPRDKVLGGLDGLTHACD